MIFLNRGDYIVVDSRQQVSEKANSQQGTQKMKVLFKTISEGER